MIDTSYPRCYDEIQSSCYDKMISSWSYCDLLTFDHQTNIDKNLKPFSLLSSFLSATVHTPCSISISFQPTMEWNKSRYMLGFINVITCRKPYKDCSSLDLSFLVPYFFIVFTKNKALPYQTSNARDPQLDLHICFNTIICTYFSTEIL